VYVYVYVYVYVRARKCVFLLANLNTSPLLTPEITSHDMTIERSTFLWTKRGGKRGAQEDWNQTDTKTLLLKTEQGSGAQTGSDSQIRCHAEATLSQSQTLASSARGTNRLCVSRRRTHTHTKLMLLSIFMHTITTLQPTQTHLLPCPCISGLKLGTYQQN
jgi:hypothetical protein